MTPVRSLKNPNRLLILTKPSTKRKAIKFRWWESKASKYRSKVLIRKRNARNQSLWKSIEKVAQKTIAKIEVYNSNIKISLTKLKNSLKYKENKKK